MTAMYFCIGPKKLDLYSKIIIHKMKVLGFFGPIQKYIAVMIKD
jgi:hypothetical protein